MALLLRRKHGIEDDVVLGLLDQELVFQGSKVEIDCSYQGWI